MFGSRDSVVGIANGYGLEDRGVRVRVPVGSRIFQTGFEAYPASYAMGTVALSPGIKRPRREADHTNQCRGQENVDQ
jgi:hypothetical protein